MVFTHTTNKSVAIKSAEKHIKLAESFCSLPSDEILQVLWTENLRGLWELSRQHCINLGELFLGNYFDCTEIFVDVENLAKIDLLIHDVSDNQALGYLRLYRLIKHFFKKVKSGLPIKVSSPEELLLAIAKEDREHLFISLLRQNYKEIKSSKIQEIAKKFGEYFDTPLEKRSGEIRQHQSLKNNFLSLAEKKLKQSSIKGYRLFEDYETAIKYYWLAVEKLMSYRNEEGKYLGDFIYMDGQTKILSYGR